MNRNGKINQTQLSEQGHTSKSDTFSYCKYEFCEAIVCSIESSLYCSLECNELDLKMQDVGCGEGRKLRKRKQSPPDCFKNNYWTEVKIEKRSINSSEEESDYEDYNNTEPTKAEELFNYVGHVKSAGNFLIRRAPKYLFDKPFPTENNFFHVEQKLEGIDPKYESLFCVMTVVEVCGYRIKLHFDGYSKEYDFWVNADCPNLFYSEWSTKHFRTLQPPKNYSGAFYWAGYLRKNRAEAAPEWNFASNKILDNCGEAKKFCIGYKLEAVVKGTRVRPKPLIQIATVADVLGNRILLHFDGLTNNFDYWTNIKSNNIHPVNWCEENGRDLIIPTNYIYKRHFSWSEYLKNTNSKSVPEDAFIYLPLREFSINMIVEVVDIVVPSIIRNACIVNVRHDVIEIVYEGFERKYSYWIEDDSPDIHPVGWCKKTNHPIEKPENRILWSCSVIGCNGKYNSDGTANHKFSKNCPYEFVAWTKVIEGRNKLPARLEPNSINMNRNGKINQTQLSEQGHTSKSDTFSYCKYEFCEAIVCSIESSLYCSLECNELDLKMQDVGCGEGRKLRKRKQSPPDCFKNNYWTEVKIEKRSINSSEEESDYEDYNNTEPTKAEELFNYVGHVKSAGNFLIRRAPKYLFDKPFPTENNFFHVEQKLEGIDPKYESLFCVMTVVEVCGYRIKLHFDGYSKEYDFWVNADCPNLFYSEWSTKHFRTLQPPKNYSGAFYWAGYLRKNRAEAAPEWNFASNKILDNCGEAKKFCIGYKLEAVVKGTRVRPKPLIQIATVADVLGNRILLHFDGLTNNFDYWTNIKSNNIHPVNWCEENGRDLIIPTNYIYKRHFSWSEYLKNTNSKSVPEDAFIYLPLREFSINMIVEVVDIVVPSIIRNACIVNVRHDVIEIVYEGFERKYSYWIEDDSPDIHPVGWCKKTNHPIEKPENRILWSCSVIGCNGKYNSDGTANHKFSKNCPYEFVAWTKVIEGRNKLPARLEPNSINMNRNGKINQTQLSEQGHTSKSDTFSYCKYEFCEAIVCSIESSLYCSLECNELDLKMQDVGCGEGRKLRKRKQSPPDCFKNNYWTEVKIEKRSINSSEEESDYEDYNNTEPTKAEELFNYVGHVKSAGNFLIRRAPKYLFDKPFPTENNFFHVEQKLEGIDPKYESLFCVMTVVEVCGYRIKLHFDGYSKEYDFWVNADCPNLFYSEWSTKHFRTLQPPKNYSGAFYWAGYLRKNRAEAAPEWNFASNKILDNCGEAKKFCIGYKLEAVVKGTRVRPKPLIQIATVADVLGNRILLHFDGLTNNFDYWTNIKSNNIHPVNWCEENGRDLIIPTNYIYKRHFSWSEYLKNTNSKSVPEDAFIYLPLREFSINMIVEVVDIVVPSIIRNACIVNVRHDVIEIVYEGFERKYSYWIEDDSPDIHPVGWCKKTNHPIEKPENRILWSCSVIGCNGKYNSDGTANHKFSKNCPYEFVAWTKVIEGRNKLPARLEPNSIV